MKARTPIQSKKVPETDRQVSGFLSVGPGGLYFHRAIEAARMSITASACLDARARFTEGNGFDNEQLASLVVNRQGQTADDILSATADNIAAGEAIVLHIGYTGLGKICSIRPIPFENIQLKKPDDLNNINQAGIFPYMDSILYRGKSKEPSAVLNLFNPDPDVVLEQIALAGGIDKYQGQILYEPFRRTGDGYYHIPDWMLAGINDIETEAGLSIYDYRTVSNGFSGSGFAVVVEEEKVPIYDEKGNEIRQESDADSLEAQISDSMGNREAGNTVVLRFKDEKTAAAFRWVEASGSQLANRYASTAERAKVNISTVMRTPGELANVRRAGGITPTGDEIRVASQLMQMTVNKWQRKVEQTFTRIFANWHRPLPAQDWSIENQNYFTESDNATVAG